jgi:AraC-like DNA-binding protein
MSGESDFLPPFRIVTDELPEKDRVAIFVEEFSRTVLNSNFEPVPDARFFHSATLRKLPGLAMMAGEGSGGSISRTRAHVADGRDDFVLQIALAGAGETSQFGCQVSAAPGEAVLMSSQDVSTTYMPGTARYMTIAIPRQALADRLPDPEASLMRLIPAGNEALRLLMGYLTLLNGGDVSLNGAALESTFVSHIYDLCALALKPTRDTFEQAQGGIRAARLHAIKQDILAHLGDAGLTLSAVAARQGVSPRYVAMLFKPEGITFSEFLLSERLARAHGMLSDPRFDGYAVAQIGYEAGFADLSYFNRCFRKRYGQTPSDVRAATRRLR